MDVGTTGAATALWVALHVFLLLILSALVVRQRRKHAVVLGDGGVPELARAIRAFGNASEYVPAGLGALITLALVGAPALAVHIAGGLLFGGRLLHAVSLSRSGGASLARSVGVVATWLSYVFAASTLLVYAIV